MGYIPDNIRGVSCRGCGLNPHIGHVNGVCQGPFAVMVEPEKESSVVDHPAHYTTGKFEVIEVIEDWKLGFNLGNSIKYIARAGKKDPKKEREDLQKAAWYLDREIQRLYDQEN